MSDNEDKKPPVTANEPASPSVDTPSMPDPNGTVTITAEKAEHGAQVVLDGVARAAARGGISNTLEGNLEAKRKLEAAGKVADGFSADGTSVSGERQADDVLADKTDTPTGPAADVKVAEGNTALDANGVGGTTHTPKPD